MSRLDYGIKYCKESPSLDEEPLQKAILRAINSVMCEKSTLMTDIASSMELQLAPIPGESMSLADIEHRLDEINSETRELVISISTNGRTDEIDRELKSLLDETTFSKEKRRIIQNQREANNGIIHRIENAAAFMRNTPSVIDKWDEGVIRQLVDSVKVISADKIIVYLNGGTEVEQSI